MASKYAPGQVYTNANGVLKRITRVHDGWVSYNVIGFRGVDCTALHPHRNHSFGLCAASAPFFGKRNKERVL
jgi:hypothetical protein